MKILESRQVVAIYCRLSKEDADKIKAGDESESIQNQKLMLMEYALNKEFQIYKVYADDDYSGFSDRPQFKQMLQDAKDGLFNIILCKHQSRFTRDMQLVEKYIHGLFVEWGIRFISLTDNVDTAIKGGKKSRQINGLINEWYCEDLSENVKSVIKAKRESGQYVGAFVCYGYKKDINDKHKLVVDKEAADVVKEIFRLYLSGMGVYSIAIELTERFIPTPAQYKKQSGSNFASPNQANFSEKYGAWAINTVRRILRNETYIGNMVQGREKSISYKTKKLVSVPKSEWAVVPNTHEPIIDKYDFYMVQNLIDNRRTTYFDSVSNPYAKPRLLAGKVSCLDCGSTLHRGGQSRDGEIIYYRCRLSKKTKGRECTPHNLNAANLEKLIERKIREFISVIIKDYEDEIFKNVYKEIDNKKEYINELTKKLTEINTKLEQSQKSITILYLDRVNAIITEEEFVELKEHFSASKNLLIEQKGKLDKEIENAKEEASSQKSLNELIEKYKDIDVMTYEIINDFVDFIQVGEINKLTNEQEIIINWNF